MRSYIIGLLAIQWVTTVSGGSCTTKVNPGTFLRCCRLDKYFTTASIDECANKCIDYNSRKQSNENECTRVNWNKRDKECSLLYLPDVYAKDPDIQYAHEDFVTATIDCSGGGTATPTRPPTRPPGPTKGVGCGKQAAQYQPLLSKNTRIIGGNTARPHSWPWQVSLRGSEGTWHFCGGSILRISDDLEESDLVLTAAHCVPTEENGGIGDFSYMSVAAGAQTESNQNTPGEEHRRVIDIQYHRDYKNLVNDVAILKLERPIRFSDTIRPACLAQEGEGAPTGRTCIASGWGRNETNSQKSQDELKQAITPVHSIEFCQNNWYWQKEAWSFAFLCAGPLDGSSAVCNGDSGGPLVCQYEDGRWVQHGVASYVSGGQCVSTTMPPVFARVATYAGWIRQKINSMSSLLSG